jgi:hypothetical protein
VQYRLHRYADLQSRGMFQRSESAVHWLLFDSKVQQKLLGRDCPFGVKALAYMRTEETSFTSVETPGKAVSRFAS